VLPLSAGGKIRIVQLARALCALGVEVTIVAPFHVTQRPALVKREPFTLRQVPYPFLLPFLLTNRVLPYGALVSFHPGYRALLPCSLAEFDVCQFDHPAFVDLVRDVPASVPVVYSSQNVEFDYVSAESPAGAVRRLAGARVRALESRLVARASHVFVCSEDDRNRFGELYEVPADRISVIPNGIDFAAIDGRWKERDRAPLTPGGSRFPRRALFTGSAVAHNHEAVGALLTRVAPGLEREVEFVIVGGCARRFRREHRPNVVFDAEADISQYIRPGTVGLNCVQNGSGTSMKLLHYLAHDLPVLTTPFGLRGFQDLSPWVTTARLEDFPQALRRELPAPRGVRKELARYQWHHIAAKALQVYQGLASRRGPH
jgi:hypothetical protein